jgi:hypothetical protein
MKHLLIYTVLIPVIIGFMIYKAVEAMINVALSVSDIEERINYQLNIFSLERFILTTIKNGWKRLPL